MAQIISGCIVALIVPILAAPGRSISATEWEQPHTFPSGTLGIVTYSHGNSCVLTTNLQANPEEDRTKYLIVQKEQLQLIRAIGWANEDGIFTKLKEMRKG